MEHKREEILNKIKRVVIKVGSSSLTYENGHLNLSKIETLVRQISDIHNRGIEVVLVSSGAIAAGMGKLGFKERPKTIPEKQAAAAVGQGTLMHIYEKIFSEYSKVVGQILLTREDMSQRTRFLNGRNTFFSLLEQGVIPIVNENDAIVVEEIKFGDNDTLSAMVASLVEADLLIILSDIDGLYDSNPKTNPEAKLIYDVEYIDENIEKSAGGAGSKVGTGGMITKISAAKIAVASGTSMAILNAATPNVINEFLRGENVGTLFCALEDKLNARKHWLTFSTKSNGKIVIDKGAEKALLENHKSLLPSGVIKVIGSFSEEEVVSILNEEELEIAKGISNYSSSEVDIIKGMNSSLIEEKLNHKNYDEIVHKNNLVILKY